MSTHGYPRPQMRRAQWEPLNGVWDFALDPKAVFTYPGEVNFDSTIVVPFSPETVASGIGDRGFFRACWYRRTVHIVPPADGDRVLLHFGAVDFAATVWINGALAGSHVGGYTPFTVDVSPYLSDEVVQEIVVRAYDDPHDLQQPRGKQDWKLAPHAIWYPRTTGIWQTVWVERVGKSAIASVQWTSQVADWEIGCRVAVDGPERSDLRVKVRLHLVDNVLAEDDYAVIAGEVDRRIRLSDPGIDDHRNELLWSPQCPTLIQAEIELHDTTGNVIDHITSYTAMRSVAVDGDQFLLNGYPYKMRLVLDQGYWPQSGMTAPDDDAIRKDVLLAKAMGFNGVRKHQKVEDPRFLYWADLEGLMVWEEMPSAYRFGDRAVERLTSEWLQVIERDRSHPCVIAWVPFNESWGVPDLPKIPSHRHYVQALYHLTRTVDPSRPVIGNDGWESVATDILGVHDYADDPGELHQRYGSHDAVPGIIDALRPGGRAITIDGHPHAGQPIVVSEFGGVALSVIEAGAWGYVRASDAEDLARRYAALCQPLRTSPVLAGFCYTQFADTYQEANGLLFADRTPKIPLDQIAHATRGPRSVREEEIERDRQLRWSELARPRQDALP
ncbi:MAG TPA: glycoside hydrolase family 2 TIM barrel-domain containing protein [Candidatus Limnocylindrales bacterium]|nr:glycoside hydrolase family 2 TIM barrel-domain containing protein [Candidatus Limnocylindrales bacterium]